MRPPPGSEAPAAARWGVVLLLAAVLFLNYVDRGALPTAAHLIQDELRLTSSQLGVLLSAFFWTYATLQIPVGWVAERHGAHRILAIGLAAKLVIDECGHVRAVLHDPIGARRFEFAPDHGGEKGNDAGAGGMDTAAPPGP